MGVILDIVPNVTVTGGTTDLTEVYEKIQINQEAIGDLSLLETENKESLVLAVNEVKSLIISTGDIIDDSLVSEETTWSSKKIQDQLNLKANSNRVKAIEDYIVELEERLSRVDIQILDPKMFLFLD